MNSKILGVYAVAVTPFYANGEFNFEAAEKNADRLIENGVHGICILGATGEYLSVTNEEHKKFVNTIVPHICDRTSVIVGATRERTEEVVDLVQNIKNSGAHAAMVLPPYYSHPNQDEIYNHYKYITENVDFPIVVYNNPHSAGVEIEEDTLEKIFKLKNIAAFKESTGDIRNLTKSKLISNKNISLLCGCDNLAYESFLNGAVGWISMLANVAPKDCSELFNSIYYEKNYEKGFEIYKKILPSLEFLETFPKPVQTLKFCLNKKGYEGGYVRRPRMPLTAEEQELAVKNMQIDILE